MPRPARFTDDDVLDAALEAVRHVGPGASVQDIAARLGGPVGSIYHRFNSREELIARLWLRSVRRFQAGVFELEQHQADAHARLVLMALHVPRYCRANPDEATALTLHRRSRLLQACPPGLEQEVTDVNNALDTMTRRLTRRRYGSTRRALLDLVVQATRIAPYGLVRPHLGGPVPPPVDDAVAAAADAILRLGDGALHVKAHQA